MIPDWVGLEAQIHFLHSSFLFRTHPLEAKPEPEQGVGPKEGSEKPELSHAGTDWEKSSWAPSRFRRRKSPNAKHSSARRATLRTEPSHRTAPQPPQSGGEPSEKSKCFAQITGQPPAPPHLGRPPGSCERSASAEPLIRRGRAVGLRRGAPARGIWKAVEECVSLGGRSFAMFLGSQRSWQRPPLDEKAAARFREACSEHGVEPAFILPHGSYLMNCGSPKQDVCDKSRLLLVDELSRCAQLGLSMFNLHPGASLGDITTDQCIQRIAEAIDHAHRQVPAVMTVLENMSGQGSTVGGQFSELRGIIEQVRDKSRVGVCLDTCHAFAAGYDISAAGGIKKVLDEFDSVVGLSYLRALHLNDSKGKLGCHLDRHEDIGRGQIGLAAFRELVNEPRLDGIPMILETPGR
ncbi:APN1 lyase, partial [Atractosteus spatula]|nr:APN1 lyase [Atractosteus spatula]